MEAGLGLALMAHPIPQGQVEQAAVVMVGMAWLEAARIATRLAARVEADVFTLVALHLLVAEEIS